MKTVYCDKPRCGGEAIVWYRLTDGGPPVLVRVCGRHASDIRRTVQPWQMVGRGAMHNGIAEGAGR